MTRGDLLERILDVFLMGGEVGSAMSDTGVAKERILVCVGPGPGSGHLVHRASLLAGSLGATWVAAAVEVPGRPLSPQDAARREANLTEAAERGAMVVRLAGPRVAGALLEYAASEHFTRVLAGKPSRTRLLDRLFGSPVDELIRGSGELEIHVLGADGATTAPLPRGGASPRGYVWAAAGVLLTTAAAAAAWPWLGPADVALGYLAPVSVAAYLHGRGPAVAASVLSVGAYNFFFVEPFFTFRVARAGDLVTFAVLFAVGLAISTLSERNRTQEADAVARERRTAALYTLSRALAGAHHEGEVAAFEAEARRRPGSADAAYADAVSRLVFIAMERIREARAAEGLAVRAQAEALRASLLSSVSHDMRTPLAVIAGAASTLREVRPALSEEAVNELLDSIAVESDRMERLIANLLQATALSGAPTLRTEWVPLDEPVGSAIRRAADGLKTRLRGVMLPAGAPLIGMDALLVEHAVLNLLDNAVRHTPEGTVVRIAGRLLDDRVEVEVTDEGAGFPAGDPARFFEPFARGTPSSAAGSGLGLNIVQGVARAHGGDAYIRALPDAQTAVGFWIPRGGAPPDVEEASALT